MINNENIEIIISRYNENLNWLNEYPFNQFSYIVYNKGNNDNYCKNNVKEIIYLQNVGRESHTYLYHILSNYDNLKDITIFFPGSLDLHYKKELAYYLLNLIINDNFNYAYFIGEYNNNILDKFYDFKLDNWSSTNNNNLTLNIETNENNFQLCKFRPYNKWYNFYLNNIKVDCCTYWGIFSIDKRDIIQHSKIRYEMLLDILSVGSNPESGHYVERSWGAIFHPMIYTKKLLYS